MRGGGEVTERRKLAFLSDGRPRERGALAISSHRCQSDLAVVQRADEPFLGFSVGPRGRRDKKRSINDIIHARGGGGRGTLAVMCAYILRVRVRRRRRTRVVLSLGPCSSSPPRASGTPSSPARPPVSRPPVFETLDGVRTRAYRVHGRRSTPTLEHDVIYHVRSERRRSPWSSSDCRTKHDDRAITV